MSQDNDGKVARNAATADVVLIGAGIMSATLGALLRLVEPDWSITLVERLDGAAAESSGTWNNAGTGHSSLCEVNYTPQQPDGSIDITKAVDVMEKFQLSRQFWAYAVANGVLPDARGFLNPVPHVSIVHGAEKVDFLHRRQAALAHNPLFASCEIVTDPDEFARRLPLMAAGRNFSDPVALNWAADGTDVDFGSLTRHLIAYGVQHGTEALFGHEVRALDRRPDGTWTVTARNNRAHNVVKINARFVFVGAGGNALRLLQRAGIPEVKGYGGFPVRGRFLRTSRPALVAGHRAKVYGFPAQGAPPMAAPHLDARIVNGKPWLVFGPFGGWTPRFLKHGRLTDLPMSVTPGNVTELLSVGLTHRSLLSYLIGQVLMGHEDRVSALRDFVPKAVTSHWESTVAGQRVHVVAPGQGGKARLRFDTTVLGAADGSIAGLLGASPGASTAVSDMIDVLKSCFSDRYRSWLPTLTEIVPSLGATLADEPRLFDEVWNWGTEVLGLSGTDAVTAAP